MRECILPVGPCLDFEEKRRDPEDGMPYTLAELRTYYKGRWWGTRAVMVFPKCLHPGQCARRYSKQEIATYWDVLKPVRGGKGKAKIAEYETGTQEQQRLR
eukprot:691081-Amphidinium_carterae.1